MSTIPVIIIGAGPVGLSASIALSRQGIRNIVIEKHPGTAVHPKARGVNVRTMELCRIWGAEQQIRQLELPVTARRFLWMNHVKGEIQGDVSFITEQEEISPTEPCLLSQDIFEQELLACLKTQKNSQVYFNTKLINIEQDDQFVYCELENLIDNTRTKIRCQYLVTADGANSFVRKKLSINMKGIPFLGTHVSVYCETDLSPWLSDKPFAVMAFTDKEQMDCIIMAVDLKRRWIFSKRMANANETLTKEAGIQLVRATADEPELAVNVINIFKWEMAALNAEQYRHGRIFLCGDAAHRIPPTGGMGMNTGIGDAHNLAWKIAYVIQGYADETLLDSYEQERKPLAQTTIDWSVVNANRLHAIFQSLIDGNNNAFHDGLNEQTNHINHLGLDVGFIYQSNALCPENADIPTFNPNTYKNKAIVGMRAPHCWFSYNNRTISTIDLFERNYVLLAGENCIVEKLKLPIPEQYPKTTLVIGKDLHILDSDYYACYQLTKEQAILVRPDGHIAWIS
ncbi:MAG: FAD-dependent monooxygenase [Gammaproteobacteria bacterium]|nr:FAD-dependent monooxygenase [Gammaproteobacteria bacterium]